MVVRMKGSNLKRSDDRNKLDLRELSIKLSVLSRSDGSAELSIGDVKTLGSIYGPVEVKLRDEKLNQASIEVNISQNSGYSGPESKSISNSIKLFFSNLIQIRSYPRSLIQINLQTLSRQSSSSSSSKNFKTSLSNLSNPSTDFSKSSLIIKKSHNPTIDDSERDGTGDDSSRMKIDNDDDDDDDDDDELFNEISNEFGLSEKAALMNVTSLSLLDSGLNLKGVGLTIGVAIIRRSSFDRLASRSNNRFRVDEKDDEDDEDAEDRMDDDDDDDDGEEDLIVVDPNLLEESIAKSLHLVGFNFVNHNSEDSKPIGKFSFIESFGKFDYSQLEKVKRCAQVSTEKLYEFVKGSFEINYRNDYDRNSSLESKTESKPKKNKKSNINDEDEGEGEEEEEEKDDEEKEVKDDDERRKKNKKLKSKESHEASVVKKKKKIKE